MPKKTFTPEQIVAKLRQVEVLISQGKTVVVRNKYVRAHAANFSNQYSWCSPPSTALRRTRWPGGSRCRCSEWGGDGLSGAGMPGPRLILGSGASGPPEWLPNAVLTAVACVS